MSEKKNIHFMGIGGSALSGVAILAQSQGFKVSGCDSAKKTAYFDPLLKRGIKPLFGHNKSHLEGIDILAVSVAVLVSNPNHPEIKEAKKRGILMTWQEFLGKYLQKDKFVIGIAGTHGKSTTTALIGLTLEMANLDPTVEIGAIMPRWQAPVRIGKSKYFVCEADEFNCNFLNYFPSVIIINNIEMDHPEFFKDFGHFKDSFKKFIKQIRPPKVLIVNEESKGIKEILKEMESWLKENKVKVIGYFIEDKFDFPFDLEYQANILKMSPSSTVFKVGKDEFNLKLLGKDNVYNALGALALVFELNMNVSSLKKSLSIFNGLERRFELLGEEKGIKVFDDYAVHPRAVFSTLKAAEQKYPESRIWAVFEPHQFSRLSLFLKEFASVLSLADKVIVIPVFKGREKDNGLIRAEDLVKKIGKKARYIDSFEKIVEEIKAKGKSGDLVIFFGAGKSYLLSKQILKGIR